MSHDSIPCVVQIRRNEDGVVREVSDLKWGVDGVGEYQWSEGNYGCDCNRRLFFQRAAGEDEDWDGGCSVGAYSVRVLLSGDVVYEDGAPPGD